MGLFSGAKSKDDKKKNKILQKAQKFARKGQTEKAVAEWKSLLKNRSDDANVYNTIGDLYLKGRQKDQALEAYAKACEIYADSGFSLKAIAVNKKILKLDPQNLDALTRMAHLHVERGMITNAKECYLAIAEYHIRTGGHDKALEAYRHIVDLDPKNLKVKLGLADLYFKQNMTEEGTRIYGEVVGVLLEQDRFDEAERFCEKLNQSQGSSTAVLRYLAQIHLAKGRIDEAHQCLQELGGAGAEDPELAVLRGEILIRKGEADQGLAILDSIERRGITEFSLCKIFRLLLKAGKTDAALEVLDDLSAVYTETRRLEELVALYGQVLEQDTDHLSARQRLADLFQKMKRQQDQILQYKEIGRIYSATGRVDEARNIYEKVLDMTPGDLEVQASLNKLNGAPAPSEPMEFGEVVLDAAADAEGAAPPGESEGKAYVIEEDIEIETFEAEADQAAAGETPAAVETADLQESPVALEAEEGAEGVTLAPETDAERESFLADNITEADVYMKYGHMKKALVHLEKNLETAPKHLPTHERLLQVFREEGNIPEQINTLLILGRLYREQEDKEKSHQAIQEVLTLDPDNEQAQRLLGEGPEALASHALEDAAPGVEDLTFEFDETPAGEAVPAAEAPREIEVPDAITGDDEEALNELLDEAGFYAQQGMADEARAIYEKILGEHPDRSDVAEALAQLPGTEEKRPVGPAEEDLEIVEPAPDSPEFGEVVESGAGTPEAVPEEPASSALSEEFMNFAEELREEIDSSVSGLLSGDGTSGGGDAEGLDFGSEIRREVEQSIASDGPIFSESDVMDIFQEFREGVQRELGEEDYETHYNLGIAYLEMGLIDEATEEFQIASQDPRRAMDCMTMIGLCHIQKGEFQKALQVLDKGLAMEGRTAAEYLGVRYEIAKVCELLGDRDRTLQELLRIHERDPEYRDVASKLKKLGVGDKEMKVRSGGDPAGKNKVSYL